MTDNQPTGDSGAFPALPESFAATRTSLHLVAARVLAAARYGAVGRLGLIVVPGGFGTPEFHGRHLLIVDGMLSDGIGHQAITNLTDAYAFAAIDGSALTHPVLDLPADPDAPLPVDRAAAALLARWFAFTQSLLVSMGDKAAVGDEPSAIQLWPEHFDVALESGAPGVRANYGGSPGDETIAEPYLYVGPHERHHGPFWNAPFGAALRYSEIRTGADPAPFFGHAHKLLNHL